MGERCLRCGQEVRDLAEHCRIKHKDSLVRCRLCPHTELYESSSDNPREQRFRAHWMEHHPMHKKNGHRPTGYTQYLAVPPPKLAPQIQISSNPKIQRDINRLRLGVDSWCFIHQTYMKCGYCKLQFTREHYLCICPVTASDQFLQTLTPEEHALPDKEIAAERDAQNAQQFCQTLTRVAPGGGHGAHIGRHARTSKRKMDLGYGMAGYDFRTLIMASELKHGLNYGFILHLYRNKC